MTSGMNDRAVDINGEHGYRGAVSAVSQWAPEIRREMASIKGTDKAAEAERVQSTDLIARFDD